MEQHQNGKGSEYTKRRLPVTLLYYEEYNRIDFAFYREKQLQGWSRKKKMALMDGDVDLLPDLAKKAFRKKDRYSGRFDTIFKRALY